VPDTRSSGVEPQLGGGRWRQTASGREPSLGGERRFDQGIWTKLIDPYRSAQQELIGGLSPASCELYAGLLLRVLPEGSAFSEPLDGGAVWSGRYSAEQRAAAVYSLGLIGARLGGGFSASLVEPLVACLGGGQDGPVRCAAAQALALLGNDRAEDPLMQAIPGSDWRFRLEAIRALGYVGGERSLDYLWGLQEEEVSLNDVSAAMDALGVLGARLGGGARRRICDYLMRVFVRGDGLRRCAAARGLGRLGERRALDSLLQAAVHGTGELQSAVVQALGLFGDPHAAPLLVGLLPHADQSVRRDVIGALVQIGQVSVGPTMAVLRHPDAEVRRAAVEVLGKLGAVEAIEGLIASLGDREADVRRDAVYTLGKLGDRRAVGAVIGMLDDPSTAVRKVAAAVLAHLGDERAVGPLCLALWDMDMTVRWYAAYALGVLGDARAVDSLGKALGDRSEHVARTAADALVSIGDASIPALVACARQGKRKTRRMALNALRQIDSPRGRAALGDLGALSS
jgi:HEAT repeat protein